MAATGAEIARAYVTILTQMPGVKRDVTKALGGVDLGPTGQSMGSKLAGGITKSLKLGVKALGATIAVGVGTALVKGFQRLDAIDTAKAKLTGLGNDTKTVSTIMKNALTSVKGTAFGLGDAATVSAAAVAAGIKPGEALTKHLKSIANNASAAGISMGEMGSIFNKAATQANGVQNDVISQLADKGIPIYQELGKVMGVTAGEVFKRASEGKVSFEQFSQAATAAAGTVANEMGKTVRGSFANFTASLGRIGAGLLSGIFPQIAPVLQATTKAFGPLEDIAGRVGEKIGKFLAPAIEGFVGLLNRGVDFSAFTPLGLAFKALAPILPVVSNALSQIAAVVGGVLKAVLKPIVPIVSSLIGAFGELVMAVLPPLVPIIELVGKVVTGLLKPLMPLVSVLANALAPILKALSPIIDLLAAVLTPVIQLIADLLTPAIGFLSKGLQWLVGVIKDVAVGAIPFLRDAWANLASFFKTAWEGTLRPVFEGIGQVLSFVWNSILKPIFDGIAAVAKWVFETILAPIFNAMQVAFAIMAGIFQGVWEGILKPVFDAFGAIFKWLWDTIISVIVAYIEQSIKVWGAIFTWLWETILKPVFDAIGAIFNWIYTYVIQPIILGIQVYIKMWAAIFTWLWNTILKPIFDAIGRIFNWILNTIIKPIVDGIQKQIRVTGAVFTWLYQNAIKPAWDAISNVISSVWNKGIKPVIDTLVKVIQSDPKKAFEGARDAIGKAWKGIQDLAKAPVKFVVQTVVGGLIDVVNGFGLNLPKPKLPKGFAGGGVLPGYMSAKRDDVLMPMRSGEGVLVPEVVRGLGAGFVHALNAVGNTGGVSAVRRRFGSIGAGLARGGLVDPLPKGSWRQSQAWGNAGHNGLDMAAPSGTKVYAATNGIVRLAGVVPMGGNEIYLQGSNGIGTRYSHLSRFAVKAGQAVRQGQVIGYVGSTGMSTGPHLHYMVHNPGLGPGSYSPNVNPAAYLGVQGKDLGVGAGLFDGLIDGAVGQIKKAFPAGGFFVDVAGGMAKSAMKGLTKVFTGKLGADTGSTGAKLYDRGGIIPHGGTGVNLSGKPEAVLTNTEMNGYKLLMRALSGAGGLGGVGGNALAGLVSGLRGGRGGVVAAVQEIASVIVSTANKVLDIHSPSRKLQTVGKYTGAGLVAGITGSVPATRAATERLVGAVLSAFDQLGSERSSLQARLDKALGNWRGAKAGSRAKANYAAQIADYRKQIAAINATIGAPGKSKQPALMTFLSTQNAKLNSLALHRAAVAKRLAAAQKTLAESADTMADWSSGIQDKINSLGGITDKGSVSSMVANLQKRITATQGFTATIEKLRKMGLDTGSIQELTESFAQSGSSKAADALLASGASGVKQVVDLRKQLDAAGGKLGSQVGNVLYQAGIDSARGLVKGLQSQEKALQAQAKKIADTITATVRKTLGIKSPSRVLMKDGRWSGLGFARGIDSSLGEVAASARAMVQMPAALTPEVSLSRSSLPTRDIRLEDLAPATRAGGSPSAVAYRLVVGEREFDAYAEEIADGRVRRALRPASRGRNRTEMGVR